MEYRTLPHGGEQISILGLGNSSLSAEVGEKEIQATVEMALENGVNYFDMAAGDAAPTLTSALSTAWMSWPIWKKRPAAARWTISGL